MVIKPTGPIASVMLTSIYSTATKTRIRTSETKFVELDLNDPAITNTMTKAFSRTFDGKIFKEEVFEYFTEKQDQQQPDRDKEALCMIFFSEHPGFLVNGKPQANGGTKNPSFNIAFAANEKKEKYNLWLYILTIANRIKNMSIEDVRNVAYYYGQSPVGKDKADLELMLADFWTGICVATKNAASFMEVWMSETNAERDMMVNVHKAIALHIFKNVPKEGRDNYYYGSELVGTSFNDVLAYCKREAQIYDQHILRTIKDNEPRPSTIESKGATPAEETELRALKEEAKKLLNEGFIERKDTYHMLKLDKLKTLVASAKVKKASAESQKATA